MPPVPDYDRIALRCQPVYCYLFASRTYRLLAAHLRLDFVEIYSSSKIRNLAGKDCILEENHSMNWKDFAKDYLLFTYKERIAILSLSVLIVVLIVLPHFFPDASAAHIASSKAADTSWIALAEKKVERRPDSGFSYRSDNSRRPQNAYYQNAYYQRSYYAYSPHKTGYSFRDRDTFAKKTYPHKQSRIVQEVDVNVADSAAWEALPGIGPVLAVRIINFRDKLGGFITIDQIREVYGLRDSTFLLINPYLKLKTAHVNKININTATKEELKVHPYIRWQLANMIVNYRSQHGNFNELAGLKDMHEMTDELYAKISPYLSL